MLWAAAVIGLGLLTAAPAHAADLWHAAAVATAASQPNSRWLRVADDRAAEGRFAAAAAAYVAAIAAGPTPPVVGVQLGDVLMAAGELAAAQASYRSAIVAASVAVAPAPGSRELAHLDDLRARGQDTALACFGLAAALDRTGQASAARQMVREGLAADPTAAVLELATLPDADIRIVPDGEVFYRLGVVRQASGRRAEAAAAFHAYLERAPGSRWAEAAQAHLVELESPAGRRPGGVAGGAPAAGRRDRAGDGRLACSAHRRGLAQSGRAAGRLPGRGCGSPGRRVVRCGSRSSWRSTGTGGSPPRRRSFRSPEVKRWHTASKRPFAAGCGSPRRPAVARPARARSC